MSKFIAGYNREQSTLFPEVLDDYIDENNLVRAIDLFIDSLDLLAMDFKRAKPAHTGRPAYSPNTLLKIYVYGYLNQIQSSRKLERESRRNVELMWLTQRLSPDFKTIADFRKDNGQGIQNVCKKFILLCREMDMFTQAIVAIDGSKFKACNNVDKNYSRGRVKSCIEATEKDIENYLTELERADRQERNEDAVILKDKLTRLRARLEREKGVQAQIETLPDKQVSYTDPDSRRMAVKHKGVLVGYNVQAAVDTKHHLILAHKVINDPSDRHQLFPIGRLAQEVLGRTDITVLADRGYDDNATFKSCHEHEMTVIVPRTKTSGNRSKGMFTKDDFIYNAGKDVYHCPSGREIPFSGESTDKGKPVKRYLSITTCKSCPIKSRCTTSKGRKITRLVDEAHAELVKTAYRAMPDAMKVRKRTVEHPFGTIKQWAGTQHLLMKGLKNVRTEVSMQVLAYNFKRMVNILGIPELMKAIKTC